MSFSFEFKPSKTALTSENCREFLKTFTGYYALSILNHENPNVKTKWRIRALKLFNQVDPKGKYFLSTYRRTFAFTNKGKLKNPLPLTLDPNQIEDQKRNVSCLYNLDIFGRKKDYDIRKTPILGILRLLENHHKQEIAQMLCTFLFYQFPTSGSNKIYLNKLFELSNFEGDIVELIFGKHASYRNKGKVTLIMDDVSHMGIEFLQKTIRYQRDELEKKEKKMRKLNEDNSMLSNQNQLLLQNLNSASHYKLNFFINLFVINFDQRIDNAGYFALFLLNPFLTHEDYLSYLIPIYKDLIKKYHPDRTMDIDKKEKYKTFTQKLNTAYEVMSKKESFNEYQDACFKRAKEIAWQQK